MIATVKNCERKPGGGEGAVSTGNMIICHLMNITIRRKYRSSAQMPNCNIHEMTYNHALVSTSKKAEHALIYLYALRFKI